MGTFPLPTIEKGERTLSPTETHQAESRIQNRHAVPRFERGCVEFDYPQPLGKSRRLSLLDMSSTGICFALPFYGLPKMKVGDELTDVVIRVGGSEIEGTLTISHLTRESEERILCGGKFTARSGIDELQLSKTLASLESLPES